MNPKMQRYFRQKLLDWKKNLLKESSNTLSNLQNEEGEYGNDQEVAPGTVCFDDGAALPATIKPIGDPREMSTAQDCKLNASIEKIAIVVILLIILITFIFILQTKQY